MIRRAALAGAIGEEGNQAPGEAIHDPIAMAFDDSGNRVGGGDVVLRALQLGDRPRVEDPRQLLRGARLGESAAHGVR